MMAGTDQRVECPITCAGTGPKLWRRAGGGISAVSLLRPDLATMVENRAGLPNPDGKLMSKEPGRA